MSINGYENIFQYFIFILNIRCECITFKQVVFVFFGVGGVVGPLGEGA